MADTHTKTATNRKVLAGAARLASYNMILQVRFEGSGKHHGPISWLCLLPNSALTIMIPRLCASAEILP